MWVGSCALVPSFSHPVAFQFSSPKSLRFQFSSRLTSPVSLLAGPVPPFLPILQIHFPIPPPLFTGAPLFLPAVRHLDKPHLLPDVIEGQLVALVADTDGAGNVAYVGVARVVAPGGLSEARNRLLKHRAEGVDKDEGRFADILCIVTDQ